MIVMFLVADDNPVASSVAGDAGSDEDNRVDENGVGDDDSEEGDDDSDDGNGGAELQRQWPVAGRRPHREHSPLFKWYFQADKWRKLYVCPVPGCVKGVRGSPYKSTNRSNFHRYVSTD